MFTANFLIALREGVEASLIVGILVAHLVKIGRRDLLPKLFLGVALAAAVPLALGAWMTWGPSTLSFQAQEIIGGGLSLVAALFVTWMIFWMGSHAADLSTGLRDSVERKAAGSGWGLIWLAVIAVGREGIETALFVWATVRSSMKTSVAEPLWGVLCGLVIAVLIGWVIYKGAVKFNLRLFFTITGYLLVLVAAGIISYGIGDLQEANVLPGWGQSLYDLSGAWAPLAEQWWFVLLQALFNVNLAPTVLQFLGWAAYLVVVLPLFTLRSFPRLRARSTQKETLSTTHHHSTPH